jgi:hypothetical protein
MFYCETTPVQLGINIPAKICILKYSKENLQRAMLHSKKYFILLQKIGFYTEPYTLLSRDG